MRWDFKVLSENHCVWWQRDYLQISTAWLKLVIDWLLFTVFPLSLENAFGGPLKSSFWL